jgi:hypothetical protein
MRVRVTLRAGSEGARDGRSSESLGLNEAWSNAIESYGFQPEALMTCKSRPTSEDATLVFVLLYRSLNISCRVRILIGFPRRLSLKGAYSSQSDASPLSLVIAVT